VRLAFCLFKYFPFGGLQRDFRRIAETCRQRGHHIDVFTMAWQGPVPKPFNVHLLPVPGLTNPGRCRGFARLLARRLAAGNYHAVIGFNKLPGLDVYFAADPCFVAKTRKKYRFFGGLGRRYRIYSGFEKAVFGKEAGTEILLISEVEKEHFIRCYGTDENRFHLLPPGISPDRAAPDNVAEVRRDFRQKFSFSDDNNLLLMIGSSFKTKGVDRSIRALAALPEPLCSKTFLLVVGEGRTAPFLRLARRLGIMDRLRFFGGRDDVPRFLCGCDLLLQPSYFENTGTAIVEAIAAGLPVLATANCGYAHYVEKSGAGLLAAEPFSQQRFNELLSHMLTAVEKQTQWRRNALDYASRTDLYSLPERAAEIIEAVAQRRSG